MNDSDQQWLGSDSLPIKSAKPYGIMGIVNVTPDSFYCESRWPDRLGAIKNCLKQINSGADIIDIGGESTRPKSVSVDWREEYSRVLPVIWFVKRKYPHTVISVDTRKSQVAASALRYGAQIINDVSACSYDPDLIDVLAQYKPGYVLMHAQGSPETMQLAPHYENVVDEVKYFFECNLHKLTAAGLPENRVALDPGIGFGKSLAHNLALLSHIEDFKIFGRPLLIGLSMKSIFADLFGLEVKDREAVTCVASAILWLKGVKWHRVHNVVAVANSLFLSQEMIKH